MNKLMRVCIIIAAVLIVVGMVAMGVSLAAGAQPDELRGVRIGRLSFNGFSWGWYRNDRDKDYVSGDLVNIGEEIAADKVTSLNISLGALDIKLKKGDTFKVEGDVDKSIEVETYLDDGMLYIKNDIEYVGIAFTHKNSLEITVPEGIELDDFNISIGAGAIRGTVDVECDSFTVDVGAGEVKVDGVVVNGETDIDCGAGSIKLSGEFYDGVSIDSGAGSVTLNGKLEGDSTVDCGMGSIQLNIDGSEDDFSCDADVGLGNMHFGSRSISGIGDGSFGRGSNNIRVSVAMGSTVIKFND